MRLRPEYEVEPLTNHVRAVVLVVIFALWALHAGLDLSTNANTICGDVRNIIVSDLAELTSWLDSLDFGTNSQDLANNFMSYADGCNS